MSSSSSERSKAYKHFPKPRLTALTLAQYCTAQGAKERANIRQGARYMRVAGLVKNTESRRALLLVEYDGLAAAILDHTLGDGDSSDLCARLTERGVPYLIYSGHRHIDGPCHGAPHLDKPALAEVLVAAVENLINGPIADSAA